MHALQTSIHCDKFVRPVRSRQGQPVLVFGFPNVSTYCMSHNTSVECWGTLEFKHFGFKARLLFKHFGCKEGFCSNILGAKQHFFSNILDAKVDFCSNIWSAKQDYCSNILGAPVHTIWPCLTVQACNVLW